MSFALRPYQVDGITRASAAFAAGSRAVLLVAPTGAGKTVVASEIIRRAVARGRRVVFLAHRTELIDQCAGKLDLCGIEHGIIQGSRPNRAEAPVQVASVQTLARREGVPPCDLLITDECFPAGTLVDGRPIEEIKSGDPVQCFDHANGREARSVVVGVMRKAPSRLVRLVTDAGSVVCTPNHPFYTGASYVACENLANGDRVQLLCRPDGREDEWRGARSSLPCLLSGRHGGEEPPGGSGHDAAGESHEIGGSQGEGVSCPPKDWPCATGSGREWNGADRGTAIACPGLGDDDGIHDKNDDGEAIPTLLQGGSCGRVHDAGDRGGRGKPLLPDQEGAGPEEGGRALFARVDRVEILERGRDGSFGGMCPGGIVYNISVATHHNYYANGFLVHNCHHITAASYQTIIGRIPSARLLGLTATPYRLDGSGLGSVFTHLDVLSTIPELIAEGFLVPPQVWGCAQAPDLSGVGRRGGDYVQRDAAAAMDKPHLVGDVVRTWAERALDRTTVCFASSVEHSQHLVEQFRAAGVAAAHLEAGTPADERRAILRALASGALSLVSNVGLLTEGWDLPRCGCVILARPTQSKSLYMQMVGRGLRSAEGKDDCLILDHAGNTARHGFVTAPQEFSLEGAEKKPKDDGPACRMCPNCFAYNESTDDRCVRCGVPLARPAAPRAMIEQRAGELERLDEKAPLLPNAGPSAQVSMLAKLRGQARERGYKPTWAAMKFRVLFGRFPSAAQVLEADGHLLEGAPR